MNRLKEGGSYRGYYGISVYYTYKLIWKPLFDGKAKAMLDLVSLYGSKLVRLSVPKLGTDGHRGFPGNAPL